MIFHLDNSETSWLVYADWLEDQDIDAIHIRQEFVDPTTTDQWVHEYQGGGVGAGIGIVGGIGAGRIIGLGGRGEVGVVGRVIRAEVVGGGFVGVGA